MNRFQTIIDKILFPSKNLRIIIAIIVGIMVPLVYLLVYLTGGIKYVYSHTMYIPIVLAGVIFGLRMGVVVAVMSAILLGPLMPIDVITGEQQAAVNWLYRSLIFISIGAFSGFFSDALRKRNEHIKYLLSRHYKSGILLFNAVEESEKNTLISTPVFVIRVLNSQTVIDHLGIELYYKLWKQVLHEVHSRDEFSGKLYHLDDRVFALVTDNGIVDDILSVLNHIFRSSHHIGEISVYLDVVIGYSTKQGTLSDVIEFAASASRNAELNNKAVVNYDSIMKKDDISMILLAQINDAIKTEQLFLVYQPIVTSTDKTFVGVEALIRWNHPTYGIISPMQFIPTIEQTHLINDMTRFLCNKVKNEILPLIIEHDSYVCINLTTKNLLNEELIRELIGPNIFTQDDKEHLVFEITESVLITKPIEATEMFRRIKNEGIRLALDDFGTGYSSLSYLGRYPLDIVKIDKSFVQQFTDKNVQKIIRTAIDLSHSLDYLVTVEGIESEFLAKKLSMLECDYMQGYYFSKPLDITLLIEYIAAHTKKDQ